MKAIPIISFVTATFMTCIANGEKTVQHSYPNKTIIELHNGQNVPLKKSYMYGKPVFVEDQSSKDSRFEMIAITNISKQKPSKSRLATEMELTPTAGPKRCPLALLSLYPSMTPVQPTVLGVPTTVPVRSEVSMVPGSNRTVLSSNAPTKLSTLSPTIIPTSDTTTAPFTQSPTTTSYNLQSVFPTVSPETRCPLAFAYCPGRSTCFTDVFKYNLTDEVFGWSIQYNPSEGVVDDCNIYIGVTRGCDISKATKVGTFLIAPKIVHYSLDMDEYQSNQFHLYIGRCAANDNANQLSNNSTCSVPAMMSFATRYDTYPLSSSKNQTYVNSYTFDDKSTSGGNWPPSYKVFDIDTASRQFLSSQLSVCAIVRPPVACPRNATDSSTKEVQNSPAKLLSDPPLAPSTSPSFVSSPSLSSATESPQQIVPSVNTASVPVPSSIILQTETSNPVLASFPLDSSVSTSATAPSTIGSPVTASTVVPTILSVNESGSSEIPANVPIRVPVQTPTGSNSTLLDTLPAVPYGPGSVFAPSLGPVITTNNNRNAPTLMPNSASPLSDDIPTQSQPMPVSLLPVSVPSPNRDTPVSVPSPTRDTQPIVNPTNTKLVPSSDIPLSSAPETTPAPPQTSVSKINKKNLPTLAPFVTRDESPISEFSSKPSQLFVNSTLTNKPLQKPIKKPVQTVSEPSMTVSTPSAVYETTAPTTLVSMANPSLTSAPSPVLFSNNLGEPSSNNNSNNTSPTTPSRITSATIIGAAVGAAAVLLLSCSICYQCAKPGVCVPIGCSRLEEADQETIGRGGDTYTMALPYGSSENCSDDVSICTSIK